MPHSNNNSRKSHHPLTPWIIWILATSVFFTEYMVRVVPRALLGTLQEIFDASQVELSTFSSYYLLPYVLMQIPVGIILDRIGARKSLVLSTLLFALATLIFSWTEILGIAQAARFLQGFAASFAFVGALKLADAWFSPQIFSILVGASQAMGMIGAAIGPSLVIRMQSSYGYNNSMMLFFWLLIIITTLVFLIVRNNPQNSASDGNNSQNSTSTVPIWKALKTVLLSKQTWIVAVCGGLLYLPTGVLGELWGGYFLEHSRGITAAHANDIISMIFVGWILGGPLNGYLSNVLGRRPMLLVSTVMTLVTASSVIYLPINSSIALAAIFFLMGVANSGVVVAYTMVAELHSKSVSGVSLGFGNGMSVFVTLLCQPIVGIILDHLMQTSTPTVGDLQYGLMVVVIGGVIAIFCAYWSRETLLDK